MKIPPSFRQAYSQVHPVLERLEKAVRPDIVGIARQHGGTYQGRIKSPESILIKAEKEKSGNPFQEMDDLFACTIIVPNTQAIERVQTDVEATFEVVEERKRSVKPEEFAYNDLNLYLKVKPTYYNRDKAYLDLVFELQIKTLLQEAWSQASHDVIYKARRKTWGLARIASQLRALLEMADSVLINLEGAASALQERREYPNYSKRNRIAALLDSIWDSPRLPSNLHRAALIVEDYMHLAGLSLEDLEALLCSEKYRKYIEARSLTPTQVVFVVLFLERWGDMRGRIESSSMRIVVTAEMLDLCPELSRIPGQCTTSF